ncbi:hypothetical protein [Deefgea piscis]|uniref:hypothetical protein n=1 Tax=Deefgea piscis TaxID=2739061 RepID=UPI001C802EB0|nr:hypothetical protein [Deefgea piscis]QZA80195.1 hypothetical protein K4H25_11695 [Deefgea piscis]
MVRITVEIDRSQVQSVIDKQVKKVNRCAAIALTKTAAQHKKDFASVIDGVFDRPTRFTGSAVRVKSATVRDFTAELSMPKRQSSYVGKEIDGGQRKAKAYERALTAAGLLPNGYVTVPGEKAPMDANGNISRTFLVAMMRQLSNGGYGGSTKGDDKKQARAYKKHGGFLVVPVGNRQGFDRAKIKQPGIYRVTQQQTTWDLDPVLIFVRKANYKPKLNWRNEVQKTVDAKFKGYFIAALES